MDIFDVFSMNGIENYHAAGENLLENVILKVSQTHFPRISTSRGGGHKFFKGGCEVPCRSHTLDAAIPQCEGYDSNLPYILPDLIVNFYTPLQYKTVHNFIHLIVIL